MEALLTSLQKRVDKCEYIEEWTSLAPYLPVLDAGGLLAAPIISKHTALFLYIQYYETPHFS